MLQRLRNSVRDAAYDATRYASTVIHETTVRLAVTGLSRAGKTVFMTSLIANLLALGRGLNTLPRLQAHLTRTGASQLRAIRLLPPGSGEVPVFEHARNLAILAAAAPDWPPHTEDLGEVALEFVLERQGMLGQRLGPRRLRLEILDYPGEWLMDLPLLEQSFDTWSRETLARLREAPRSLACAPFLEQLASVEAGAAPDHGQIRRLHDLYRSGLNACRTRFNLRLLQPGRFLCPGSRADAPLMWFFPLEGASPHPAGGTADALLRERFEAYKADMRARFFETHFAQFDRQIMLVDVLGALHAGRNAFGDTEQALALIAASLSYGRNRFGRAAQEIGGVAIRSARVMLGNTVPVAKAAAEMEHLLTRRQIERVAFVATKADHVPALRRENLRNLLRDMVSGTREPIGARPVSFHTAAAVLATADAVVLRDGLSREVVRGTPLGGDAAKLFDPGDVPSGHPHESFWDRPHFVLPVFEPPRIQPLDGSNGVPHLGVDDVLTALLEDVL
jgi:hypothetical protein